MTLNALANHTILTNKKDILNYPGGIRGTVVSFCKAVSKAIKKQTKCTKKKLSKGKIDDSLSNERKCRTFS